jgi:DnaJ-class molecular chaperone
MSDKKTETKGRDFYAILEIERTATDQEITSAYRKSCMKWHPVRKKMKFNFLG